MGRTRRIRRQRQQLTVSGGQTEECSSLPGLFQYLNSLGWRNHACLTVRNFPSTGRGLCSKSKTIREGAEIIRLPANSLISITTLEDDHSFRALFDPEKFVKEYRITFQSLVAFYLLHHKRLEENSPLNAYIRSIPSYFTTPYFCPVAELECLPEAILECTVAQNRKIRESYNCLKQIVGGDHFEENYLLNDFRWAYFAVNTRSVYVPGHRLRPENSFFQTLLADECNLALAPFLDLFNHSDSVQTTADLLRDPMTRLDFVLTLDHIPTATVPRNKQIYISYGCLNNLKLLVEYGFILPSNKHDYFEFSLRDIANFINGNRSFVKSTFHRNKFQFIRDHNLNDQLFVHTTDGISHNLHVVMHLLFKEQSYFTNVLNQVAFGCVEQLESVSVEVKLLMEFKCSEYRSFIKALDKLPYLSRSGLVAKSYLEECLHYLEICLGTIE